MTTTTKSDRPGYVSLTAVEATRAESARYQEAIDVFQQHHDHPGTITDDDLAIALRAYLQHWDRHIRQAAYRFGFTSDDVDLVAQIASAEFFVEKVLTGKLDPAKSQFSILRKLIIQRAIDHWRSREAKKESLNIEGLNRSLSSDSPIPEDPYAGAPPTPSAEDVALDATTLEEAAERLCADAGLDPRETAIITYRYVHQITDWHTAAYLINAELPPPITWTTFRNICRGAKKKIQTHLDTRTHEEDR